MKKNMKKTVIIIGMCVMMLLSAGCSISDRVQKEIFDLAQPSETKEEVYSEPTDDVEEDTKTDDVEEDSNMEEQVPDAEFREGINQINLGIDSDGTFEIGVSLDGMRVFPAHTEWDNPSSIPVVAAYYSVYNFSDQPVSPLTELEEHIKFNFNGEYLASTQSMAVANFESGADEMLASDSSGMYATLFMMPYFPEEDLARMSLQVEYVADDGTVVHVQEYSIGDMLDDYVF